MLSPPLVRCHQGFAPTWRRRDPRLDGAFALGADALRRVARCRSARRKLPAQNALVPVRWHGRVARIETPWERM